MSLDKGLFGSIEAVYNGLVAELLEHLTEIDAVDLCYQLYERHEVFLGNLLKVKHQSVPEIVTGNSTEARNRRLKLWGNTSTLTESTRWLVEIVVKHCESPGKRAGNAKVDYLIALAQAIYWWDGIWEHLAHSVIPHELTIRDDFGTASNPTRRAKEAWQTYQRALQPYMVVEDRAWAESVQPPQEDVDLDELIEDPVFKRLDQPLREERGYSLGDWVHFSFGLVDFLRSTEHCKITRKTKLSQFLSHNWDVPSDRFDNLLVDHGLSKDTLADIEMAKLRPMEYARRDSRLARRPVVVLEEPDRRMCIYGAYLIDGYANAFQQRLESGRISLPGETTSGPLRRAIGGIQQKLGHHFSDEIRDQCTRRGYQAEREKGSVRGEMLPQGRGFGPVDVFVVDRSFRRFVLVEAKDLADEGTVPRIMRGELKEFLKETDELGDQVAWFANRLGSLKDEYGVPLNEEYDVVGVIVVSIPRLWLYTHAKSLPIVSDKDFFKALKTGGRFQTDPVPL